MKNTDKTEQKSLNQMADALNEEFGGKVPFTDDAKIDQAKVYSQFAETHGQFGKLPDKMLQEDEVPWDDELLNKATEMMIVRLEMLYSYYNHKEIWTEFHPNYWTVPNMFRVFKRHIKFMWQAKFWERAGAKDLYSLQGKCKGPAIIIGSAPTLDDALPLLKDWKGAIFCNSSQASTLIYHGRHPEWIDVVDPRVTEQELAAPFDQRKTSLIITPCIHPRLREFWKGKKYYYRIWEPTVDFYSKMLPFAFNEVYVPGTPRKKYNMEMLAYSLPFGSQCVTALGHATYMGYDPIFFVGVNYCFKRDEKNYRFTSKYQEKGKWVIEEHPVNIVDPPETSNDILVDFGDDKLAHPIQLIYRNQTIRVVYLDAPQIFHTDRYTILPDEIPYIPIEDVIRQQGKGFEDMYKEPEEIRRWAEVFLAERGMFLIPFQDTERFVKMENWEQDLTPMVAKMNNIGAGIEDVEELRKHIGGLFDAS